MPSSRRAIWRTSLGGAAALTVLASGFAARAGEARPPWQALGVSGTLRGTVVSHDFSLDRDSGAVTASAWFTAEPQRIRGVKTFADGRIQREWRPQGTRTSWDLREAYLERAFGAVDLKIGRQIIVWGRADKINPTDVWSVRDLTLVTTDDEDQRLGAAAVQVDGRRGPFDLVGVWQPEWRAPVFPLPRLPAGLTAHTFRPAHPESRAGFKIDHSGAAVDWSLSYAHAIDKTPDLLAAAPSSLGIAYRTIDMYGADAAAPVGRYGLRGEMAYTRRARLSGAAPLYDDLFLVAGAERTFGGEFNINIQYLYRRDYGFQDPARIADPARRRLAVQEDILANQYARDQGGLSVHLVDRFLNETLVAELGGVIWFGRGGGALQPKVSYALTDRWQLTAGGQVYFGPKAGFFGQFRDASTLFAEIRWGF
jgi:hypothetical protein